MKIEEMKITQIEEFIRDNFPNTNLTMRCLECGDHFPLSEMDLDQETCDGCREDVYYCENCGTEQVDNEFGFCASCQAKEDDE